MKATAIHPAWAIRPRILTEGFSIEITAKDIVSLEKAAHLFPAETPVAIAFLPNETMEARIDAAKRVRALGFEAIPHISARRIGSLSTFETMLRAVIDEAGVRYAFVIAGDPPVPEGPFADSSALIATGTFERMGILGIGLAGHPEGHPSMSADACWEILRQKSVEVERRGMSPLIVTQFAFNPEIFLDWLAELRRQGIDAPVRIGVPGPAGVTTLMRYASRCGVGASTAVLAKYGISLTKLMSSAGPDKLVDALAQGLGPEHGPVRLHFYSFGGLEKTGEWIAAYSA